MSRADSQGRGLQIAPLPPEERLWSLGDERALLASMLMAPWDSIATLDGEGFDPADFWRDAHRMLYAEIRRLCASGEDPDLHILLPALAGRGLLDACGGAVYVAGLADSFGGSILLPTYARRVQRLASRRALTRALLSGLDLLSSEEDPAEAQAALVAQIGAVGMPDAGSGHLETPSMLADAVIRGMHDPSAQLPIWPTGLPDVDRLLSGGLRQGGLYVIGGRAKNGKSALMLAILAEMAQRGVRYHLDSLEMTATVALPDERRGAGDIARKMVAYMADVDSLRLADNPDLLGPERYGRIRRAATEIHAWSGTIDARPMRTIDQIATQARRLKARHPDLQILAVDHAGLVRGRPGEDRRNTMIGVTGTLKALAKELDLAVLLCAQINREAVGRIHPLVSDLKESGSLEEDCDGALLVMNPKASGMTQDCTALWVSLPVHRHGPCGDYKWLDYDPATGRIGLECPDPTPREDPTSPTLNRDWQKKKK